MLVWLMSIDSQKKERTVEPTILMVYRYKLRYINGSVERLRLDFQYIMKNTNNLD